MEFKNKTMKLLKSKRGKDRYYGIMAGERQKKNVKYARVEQNIKTVVSDREQRIT